ncbi:protein SHOOT GRAVITROPISM 6-like [Magnolia sinica]|uniref:protein SHOOT GRAVITROPISM 6-like n=1 Tax=Magnolia sinica TaxID=86752 RepID=UPI002659C05E|nr:protein SHOOT GRAVITROPISM 6-like [Magnolia sinica]
MDALLLYVMTVKQSAEGAIQAVIEFITRRGNELNETDVSRITQSLLSATMFVTEKHLHQEVLGLEGSADGQWWLDAIRKALE